MIDSKDIAKISVFCDLINFTASRNNMPAQGEKIEYQVTISWGVYSIKNDNMGVKSKVKYIINSSILNGELEVTVKMVFNQGLDQNRFTSNDSQKQIAQSSTSYVSQWIADVTAKMGFAPLVIAPETLNELISKAK